MRTTWTFHTAGHLLFGRDAAGQLGDVVRQIGGTRCLIVTDKTLVAAGVVERARSPLVAAGIDVHVFDGGKPEPPVDVAEECIAVGREFRPDVVLGLGGGSNMDLAKITATVLAHGGTCRDYAGDGVVPGPVLPLVCVPTTAGTGSEVSAASVLSDPQQATKFGILSNFLRPRVAVVDPLLTVSCPAKVTADSGIDALSHAVEALTAIDNERFPLPEGERTVYQGHHAMGDLVAERAIELVGQFLRRAVADGNDLEARDGMALAATLAGMAFSNVGVAVVHALEYPIGGATHCSHGAGNGLLLPYVMDFNKSACLERTARVGRLLGEDVAGMSDAEAAAVAVAAVAKLRDEIGVPGRLRDLGVTAEQLPVMAEKAFGVKRILRVNPRAVTCDDLLSILQAAY
ncbi:MAG: iron-containing alcohol dehydrogenase [Pirellulales bacterium]